jgi:hypothetical protein
LARSHFVLLTLVLSALQLQSQAPKPLWEVDLSRFGYQGRPPAALLHVSPDAVDYFDWAYQQGVAFTDRDVVAAYFVVYDAPSGVSEPREPKISDPFRLVAVFLNAKTGELIRQLDWTLPPDDVQVSPSFFYPAAEGRFIVVLGRTVNLYSSDFKLLAHFEAHGEPPVVSPSGESLLLTTFARPTVQYDLLDTEKLSVLKSWQEPTNGSRRGIGSLWGDRITWMERPSTLSIGTAGSESKKLLAVRPESCDWLKPAGNPTRARPMCDAQENLLTVAGDLCEGWQLIGKDSLVGAICSGDDKLLTVSADGKILHEFNLGLERTDGPFVASANGQRFVIPTARRDRLTARVFDLGLGNALLTVDVPARKDSSREFNLAGNGDARFGWGGVALSPDGYRLAVKSGGTVAVYSVPEQAANSPCTSNCDGRAAPSNPPPRPRLVPKPPSPLVKEMLSWFPADTETLMGATGPLQMPKVSRGANGVLSLEHSPDEVRDKFKLYFLMGLLRRGDEFKDTHIAAAINGSRSIRPTLDRNKLTFQGCSVVVFTEDITARAAAFLKDSASQVVRTEQIEGQAVEVFEDKPEGQIVTTYVAFPKPDVAVFAIDESYLREVLARMGGKRGERALPDTLAEWKHVDTNSEFWGLIHYPETMPSQTSMLPYGCTSSHSSDVKLSGLTVNYPVGGSKVATIDYLSGDEEVLHCIQKGQFRESEMGVPEMHQQYSEPEGGVLEGSYDLSEPESADYFLFVAIVFLGYPVVI